MLRKLSILCLAFGFVLAACHAPVYNQTEGNVADVKIKMAEARHKSDRDARPSPSLVMKSGLYVDTTPVSLARNPAWLNSHIVVRGEALPFSYYSRTVSTGAGKNILTKYQPGLDVATNISVNYSGSIKGALDLIASKSGYVYSVHGSTIYWQAYITRTFEVAFMPGGTDYLMGKKSGSSGGAQPVGGGTNGQTSSYTNSDSSDSEYSNLSAKLSVWDDVQATIKQLLSPQGTVTVSQATTSVTVRDRPANVQLIGQYIGNLNNSLSKQVLVKVQVLEVLLENDYTFGINWGTIARAFHNSPFMINGSYGTPVSITALTPQNLPPAASALTSVPMVPQIGLVGNGENPSYTVLFNALNQQGKTALVSEPRVVCLNNQVSVIRIVQSEGYLASIQNTSLASGTAQSNNTGIGTVTSQVTPGTVITGLTLYILPKILNQKVYLQVNADLSSLISITSIGPTNSQIQVPKVIEKHFNQRSMIRSGETLILSGFRQVKNVANANQFINSQALGGKGSSQVNTETIILITPILLSGNLS
ncbi:MAG TPA: secretin N-terminal domain-containing protein [Gammaproteobacteria bacterium]|jgi:type IVB pilus formation R64 PilN family outer membrane protein|nr:secretin N-terminal domain-containing protein [Gammaproteobacteria bacterium]